MTDELIKTNLEQLMKAQGYSMKSLSLAAGLNETAVRDILKNRVASPTYNTLSKLASVLKCGFEDLAGEPKKHDLTSLTLPSGSSDINIKLFAKAIAKVDFLIRKNNVTLNDEDRARVYLAWYDLSLINQGATEEQFATILKFAKK